MIEVEVHQQLRAFLRDQGEPYWHHHLTMARLVARALRIGRSALIQAGAPSGYHGRYRLSYLMPLLIWQEPVVLVATEVVQQRLLMVEFPRLRQWIQTNKEIQTGDRFPSDDFQGLLLTTPEAWLSDRLHHEGRFPAGIPTIIDGVDDLETWTRQQLTAQLHPSDWNALMMACPEQIEQIRDTRVQLTRSIFQHPANPYDRYLVDPQEQEILAGLYQSLQQSHPEQAEFSYLPAPWQAFRQALSTGGSLGGSPSDRTGEQMIWAAIARQQGQFFLHASPVEVGSQLQPIWSQQPVVLIGGTLDSETEAKTYRQRMGLGDLTCLKFSVDRQNELIQLYVPDRLPMPNTPQFQPVMMQEIRALLGATNTVNQGLTVVLVEDVPLKAQVGSMLAAEYGSRVQVEKTCLDDHGVLITGWGFWRQHQAVLPAPNLLIIATLPIPSLEDPLVAGRVAHYKQLHQDWFRLYLLPETLSELQRAIAPIRENQGVVALLDNRVNHRSYGQQVLTALSPAARINYIDASLFSYPEELKMRD